MSAVSTIFVTCIVLLGSECIKLPDYITPCSRNDPKFNQCALEQGRKTIPHIVKGDRKYGVPVLDPFLVKEMRVQQFGFTITVSDLIAEGVKDADLQDVRIDFDKLTMSFQFQVPLAVFRGKYDMAGKLMNMPISGKGELNATLVDVIIKYKAFSNLTKKSDGQTYLTPFDYELMMEPKTGSFYFGNLFNGNKLLADAMNNFFNENFQLILKELGQPTYKALGMAVHQIVLGFAEKVPYDELFTKDN